MHTHLGNVDEGDQARAPSGLGAVVAQQKDALSSMFFDLAADRATSDKTRNTCYDLKQLFAGISAATAELKAVSPLLTQDEEMAEVAPAKLSKAEKRKRKLARIAEEETTRAEAARVEAARVEAARVEAARVEAETQAAALREAQAALALAQQKTHKNDSKKDKKKRAREEAPASAATTGCVAVAAASGAELKGAEYTSAERTATNPTKSKKRKHEAETPVSVSAPDVSDAASELSSAKKNKTKGPSCDTKIEIKTDEASAPVTPRNQVKAASAAFVTPSAKPAISNASASTVKRVQFSLKHNRVKEFDKEIIMEPSESVETLLSKKSPGSAIKSPAVKRLTI